MPDETLQKTQEDEQQDQAPLVDIETFKLMREDEDFEIVPHCSFGSARMTLNNLLKFNIVQQIGINADIFVMTWKSQGRDDHVHAFIQGWNRLPTN